MRYIIFTVLFCFCVLKLSAQEANYNWLKLSGGSTTCALNSSGEVYCWGYNSGSSAYGTAVVPGSSPNLFFPSKVPLPGVAQDLATSLDFACALIQGEVYCWGIQASLSVGQYEAKFKLRKIDLPLGNIKKIDLNSESGSNQVGCVLYSNGELYCWGKNDYSHMGVVSSGVVAPTKIQLENVSDVAVAPKHICAISNDTLYCWGQYQGANFFIPEGDLSLGQITPTPQASLSGGLSALRVSSYATCVLQNGVLRCGKSHFSTQLTTYDENISSYSLGNDFEDLMLGNYELCYSTSSKLFCRDWESAAFVEKASLRHAKSFTSEGDENCFLSEEKIYCWGSDRIRRGSPTGEVSNIHLTAQVKQSPYLLEPSKTECMNGAVNSTVCDQCVHPYAWVKKFASYPGTCVLANACMNDTPNYPLCNECPAGYVFDTNSLTCKVIEARCPSGQVYDDKLDACGVRKSGKWSSARKISIRGVLYYEKTCGHKSNLNAPYSSQHGQRPEFGGSECVAEKGWKLVVSGKQYAKPPVIGIERKCVTSSNPRCFKP